MRYALVILPCLATTVMGGDYVAARKYQFNLTSKVVGLRIEAARGFGQLARSSNAGDEGSELTIVRGMASLALHTALQDSDARVRLAAAESIAKWGWEIKSAIIEAGLQERINKDTSPKVRAAAVEALNWIRYNPTTADIPAPPPLPTLTRRELRVLERRLASPDAKTRLRTIITIAGRSGSNNVTPVFLQATFDADAVVRDAAMQQLWRGGRATANAAALSYAVRRNLSDSHVAELVQRVGRNGNSMLGQQMLKRVELSGRLNKAINAKLRIAFIDAATRLGYRVSPDTLVALTNRIETYRWLREPAFDAIAKLAERTRLIDIYVHKLGKKYLPESRARTFEHLGGAAVGVAATRSTPLIVRTLAAYSINPQVDSKASLGLARRLISVKKYRPACQLLLFRFLEKSQDDRRSMQAVSLMMKYEQRPVVRKSLSRLHDLYMIRVLSRQALGLMKRQAELRKKTQRLQFERTFGTAAKR